MHVLDGGLKKWKQEEKPTVNSLTEINRSIYKARELSLIHILR